MYASFDYIGNEYLLVDSLVDYRKNNNAMSLADQSSVLHGRPFMRNSTAGWHICTQ